MRHAASGSLGPALRWGAIVAGVLIVAVALAAVFLPWNALRGLLAGHVGRELNRDVTIGHLDVKLGRITRHGRPTGRWRTPTAWSSISA
jgi:uncharacterized protein involved in outer membrane biogenesis